MIFVDASTFLRYLAEPATPHDEASLAQATVLFEAMDDGAVEITTSEAILAEVVFVLWHRHRYGLPRAEVNAKLKALLRPRHCHLSAKDVCLHALDLWAAHPKLSFPDALGAAYSERRGHELATFDVALSRTPGVRTYSFAPTAPA